MNFKKYLLVSTIISLSLISIRSIAQKSVSKIYYIDTTGSDNNPGTKAAPFKTIQKLNTIYLKPGDVINLRAGQTFTGTIKIDSGIRGSKLYPITIRSYRKGKAIIDGGNNSAISLYKTKYFVVSSLILKGNGRKNGNTEPGISIVNSSHIWLNNNMDISGFQKAGVLIYDSQNIDLKNVFVHDNGDAGIKVEGPNAQTDSKNIQIINCRAENNPGDPTNLTNHSGNGIVLGDCKNVLISHCTATNNGWDMPRIGNGPVGIWAYQADHVIIQYCLSYRNKTSKGAADGGGFDLDGGVTNSIIQYCVSYENQGSGYCIFQYWGASPWYHNIFRYNISENDGTVSDSQAGLYIWNSSDDARQFYDCEVYGNIIYNSKVAAITFSDQSENQGFKLYNNVFVAKDSLIKGKDKIGKCTYTRNDWWSLKSGFNIKGIKTLKAWAMQSGKEMKDGKVTGLNIFPDFRNPGNAHITSASQIPAFIKSNYQLPHNSKLRAKLKLLQLPSN